MPKQSPSPRPMDAEHAEMQAALCAAVRREIVPLFAELQRFVDRRLAELSVEVHALGQLLGYTEETLSGQLTLLHEQVDAWAGGVGTIDRTTGLDVDCMVPRIAAVTSPERRRS